MFKAWLKVHALHIFVAVLWLAGVGVSHFKPEWREQVLGLSTVLLLAGFQLPPFTLKGAAEVVKPFTSAIALVVMVAVVACTPREQAKDAYYVESRSCIEAYDTRVEQEHCLERVRARWDEAGAPPAATVVAPFDAGSEVLQ